MYTQMVHASGFNKCNIRSFLSILISFFNFTGVIYSRF